MIILLLSIDSCSILTTKYYCDELRVSCCVFRILVLLLVLPDLGSFIEIRLGSEITSGNGLMSRLFDCVLLEDVVVVGGGGAAAAEIG